MEGAMLPSWGANPFFEQEVGSGCFARSYFSHFGEHERSPYWQQHRLFCACVRLSLWGITPASADNGPDGCALFSRRVYVARSDRYALSPLRLSLAIMCPKHSQQLTPERK